MKEKRNGRYATGFAVLLILIAAAALLSIAVGNLAISVKDLPQILFFGGGSEVERTVVFQIRLPRLILAGVLGGALAVSGFLLQTFFSNPIAGPYILGISSGAKMTVAVTLVLFVGRSGSVSQFLLVVAAFAGSLVVTGCMILISGKVRQSAALLAAGIMVGYICSAITDFLVTFADNNDIVNLHSWSQGSFSGADLQQTKAALLIVAVAMVVILLLSKPIGAFQMGEAYAQSMGVHVKRYRVLLILLSSVLSAAVTAFAGPISFVGIAVPFLMREVMRTSKPIILIPASFLGGAVFCMCSDLLARTLFSPTELNISTVTSIFGAPIVIYMLLRRQQER